MEILKDRTKGTLVDLTRVRSMLRLFFSRIDAKEPEQWNMNLKGNSYQDVIIADDDLLIHYY